MQEEVLRLLNQYKETETIMTQYINLLNEKDYEYLSKGIAIGVGIGIILGAITGEIILFFSLGGVLGIIGGAVISIIKKIKIDKDKRNKKNWQ